MLHVFLRENSLQTAKEKFVFRSENAGTFTLDNLLDEMAENNTTITRADLAGAMNVYKTILLRYLLLGYTVYTPLGYLFVSARGTADDDKASFTPTVKESGHKLHLCFSAASDVASSVTSDTKLERTSTRFKMMPLITSVKNGDGGETLTRGEIVRVTGEYLKFDQDDEEQGIFLTKDDITTRLDYYSWNTDGRIDALLPLSLEGGTYTLSVKAKPNTVLYTDEFKTELTVA